MGHGFSLKIPSFSSKNKGTIKVIMAAKTQCTLAPKDCPVALNLFGNISEIKTHITAPCPTACAAMNSNKKDINTNELAFDIKQPATNDKLII